jgi:hypothetical protein
MRIRRKTKRRIRRLILMSPLFVLTWFVYLVLRSPSSATPLPVRVRGTPQEVERGRYLFTSLLACDQCHSPLDFTRLHNPVFVASRGTGRGLDLRGLPGTVTAPNLTMDPETGLGKWSDGEIIRAIREGIDKQGRALYPLMPYEYYRKITDEDVMAVVAYIKTLPPTPSSLPRTDLSFLTRVFIKANPRPVGHLPPQDDLGGAIYGEYLTGIAACESCHTPPAKWFRTQRFAGGVFFETPYGQVYSSNITQDYGTGIGKWNFRQFEASMHQHQKYKDDTAPKVGGDRFTVMPWESYAGISDKDLESMFLFLRGAAPVVNIVQPHPGVARQP